MQSNDLALLGGQKAVTLPSPRWPRIAEEEIAAVVKQLLSGSISECGRAGVISEFEDAFAAYQGRRYSLSFSDGTASIHASVFAAGVGPGDEVLQTSNTWISAINAIMHGNGIPVFCDVTPDGFTIDPDEIRRKAGPRTRAVIVTHLWGVPAPMDEIMVAAKERNLVVIEDCSHAHGATYKGKKVGSIGDMGCFSLQGSKSIVAGEGGVMVTDDRRYYERAMLPGHHDLRLTQELTLDETKRYATAGLYWKYRASPLGIALANAQLKHLDEWTRGRRENRNYLKKQIEDIEFIVWPKVPMDSEVGFYGTPLFYDQRASGGVPRDVFLRAMSAEGVPFSTGYRTWYLEPLFQDQFFYGRGCPWSCPYSDRHLKYKAGDLPRTEELEKRQMILWISHFITPAKENMDQFAEAFHKVAKNIDKLKSIKAKDDGVK
jgi:dTDP-4-amino-4,6-dideoxygalactose transaminase